MTTPAFLCCGRRDHLPERKLLGGGYPQESNSKSNVCQGINVTKEQYNIGSDLGGAGYAGLISPFINNIICKIYNKSYTDQEFRTAQEFPVFVCDHKIDLVHAEKNDIKAGENPEIRGEIIHLAEDQVFRNPNQAGNGKYGENDFFTHPEEAPVPELPENEDPFQEGVGIINDGIVLCGPGQISRDYFGCKPNQEHKKKGLIGFAQPAETNQPRNTGYDRNNNGKIAMEYIHSLVEAAAVIAADGGASRSILERLPVADCQGFDANALLRFGVKVHIVSDNIISI
jgi:hypothetical protein